MDAVLASPGLIRASWLRLSLLALLALPSAGCLAFEQQTVFVAFTPNHDEVRVLLVYEGFQVAGNKPEDLEHARNSLTQLATSDQVFYLGSPLLPFSLAPEMNRDEDARRLNELLRRHVTVRGGA